MFKSFWDSQERQESPSTPNSSSGLGTKRTSDHPWSSSHVRCTPAEAEGIVSSLKNIKNANDFQKLLNDKDVYNAFLLSIDQLKIQNNQWDELRKETTQLARENLEKEPQILELRTQCRIIRTTELAAAQEKLNELERQKDEYLRFYSPSMLLQRMQGEEEYAMILRRMNLCDLSKLTWTWFDTMGHPDEPGRSTPDSDAMNKAGVESEILHRQLIDKEIDLASFVEKYKKLRTIYHRRALLYLAAKTSSG
ncbi:vacuolar protein-sorting-associated protein 37 homolog 1-like isoform X1 [Magnolia sinica]|uniref:vacuolar protein-sorting-associated protein 37 homolog 1-like isoform X1 n=1 Tax=Magnolia sinica TaxID=86752 RepID=UPI002659B689|nr:vacuolar protein-sorting-associated protein 37 homolog 1-like isoform X1 [Magnolia sinica]